MPAPKALTEWNADTIAKAVKSDGIVVLSRFFDNEKLAALNAEFDALFAEPTTGVHTHQKTNYLHARSVNSSELDSGRFPVLSSLGADGLLREAAKSFFDGEPIIFPHKIFATLSSGTEETVQRLPFVAHTDRFHMFKYMIYLHDVRAENGAMAAAPGRHKEAGATRLEWIRSGRPYDKRPNIIPQYDAELVPVEAEAGSVLVFDTDVPHKAGRTVPGQERRALRIDIVCPSYAGTTGKQSWLGKILRKPVVTD